MGMWFERSLEGRLSVCQQMVMAGDAASAQDEMARGGDSGEAACDRLDGVGRRSSVVGRDAEWSMSWSWKLSAVQANTLARPGAAELPSAKLLGGSVLL